VHKELLLDCPVADVRKFIVVLLRSAIEKVSSEFHLKLLLSFLKNIEFA
jgi:hypothetical protein